MKNIIVIHVAGHEKAQRKPTPKGDTKFLAHSYKAIIESIQDIHIFLHCQT